jgi:hypothetical protein
MHTITELLDRCRRLGLELDRDGDNLAVSPPDRITPELAAGFRAYKTQLLALLTSAGRLRPDELAWLHVAAQVNAGEFDPGTRSELESVWIGVRNIQHPACQSARARLETLLSKPRKEARP